MQFYQRIKKYLFLLSLFFLVGSFLHIGILYLYEGAETVPEKGGIFSIGIIGPSPSLNPTQYRLDSGNDFALRFLYRGLVRFNVETRKMEGDLANCDISKSFGEIRCFFKSGSLWSTGDRITEEDVLATYSLLAETDINKRLQGSLAKLAITREDGAIVFRSSTPSSEILQYLAIPIVKKSVAEKFRTNSVKPEDAVFSGNYAFDKKETIAARNTDQVTLVRNTGSTKEDGYSKIVLRFAPDAETLFAQKESLNLIYPDRSIENFPGTPFVTESVHTPDFIAAFLNSERMKPEVRKTIADLLFKEYESRTQNGKFLVKNPFLSEAPRVVESLSGSVEGHLKKLGYFSKQELLDLEEKASAPPTATGAVSTGTIAPSAWTGTDVPSVPKSRYVTAPADSLIYLSGPEPEIVISGKAPSGTDAVFFGAYRLKSFDPRKGTFLYRARADLGNLKEGKNAYAISFEKNGTKIGSEDFTIWMIADAAERAKKKEELFGKPALLPVVPATPSTSSGSAERKELLAALDPNFRYTRDGKPVVFSIRSVALTPSVTNLTNTVAENLKKYGIRTQVEILENTPESIDSITKGENKNADIFITGVNLGYLGTYIFPYFHSGQAEDGYNFSRLRSPGLDVLLEELKSKDLPETALKRTEEGITDILRSEAVIVPLEANSIQYAIDKNVNDFKELDWIPSAIFLSDLIEKSYIKKAYIIQGDQKSMRGFIKWFILHSPSW